ncbi:hypothetical protein AAG906_013285 [Vitis piasezkii]
MLCCFRSFCPWSNKTFEKLGTIGTSTNLLVYLATVFNMKSITATTLVNLFNGSTNFATLLGALLCDTMVATTHWGMLVITLKAVVQKLHPSHCGTLDTGTCIGPTAGQMAFLLGPAGGTAWIGIHLSDIGGNVEQNRSGPLTQTRYKYLARPRSHRLLPSSAL